MKTNMKLRSALVVFITLSGLPRTLHGQGTAPSGGYSAQELQSAISQVSAAVPGARICEIRLLAGGTPPYGLVALTRKGPDWRIVYAEYSSSGVFSTKWVSPVLPDEFAVADPQRDFSLLFVNANYAAVFHGCARHLCPDLVFGYYLYILGEKDDFQVTVVRGKATYSPNLLLPKNSAYKDFLDKKVRARPDAP